MDDDNESKDINKICGVCGDRALGYNFNAVSCESCKAFFRRNALKNKDFRCPFSQNCSITPVTRRFCQKCRLEKCFAIGMRKECIMSEEDKALKRQKIELNRAKKRRRQSQKLDDRKHKSEDISQDEESLTQEAENSPEASTTSSLVSETYFWDSGKKYVELEASERASGLDSLSPVAAASVPSPFSPSENNDIVSSKTLEMLKSSGKDLNFVKYEFGKSKLEDELVHKKKKRMKLEMEIKREDRCETTNTEDSLLARLSQDPQLVSKLVSNTDLMQRIVQNNQDLVVKLLMESEMIDRISKDREVVRFFEPRIEVQKREEEIVDEEMPHVQNEKLCMIQKQGCEKNPILKDLINSSRPERVIRAVAKHSCQNDVTKDVLNVVQQSSPTAASSIESILCEAIKLEFSAYSSFGDNFNSRELNDSERAKLNELIVANKALLAPLDDEMKNLIGEEYRFNGKNSESNPVLLDIINLTAIAIRRLIKMSKKINAFKNMCQEDQLALLKGGCTEMMILRSALSYDPDKDTWRIPRSQEEMMDVKVDVLKEAKGNLYKEHAHFVRTFDSRWRDESIILILSAIALFTPERPKVVHSDVIKLEQNSYYYLLRRYLESVYPGCEAKSVFLKLIQKISELHRLNEEVVSVYLNVNPSSVEPLLIEIFDLKH